MDHLHTTLAELGLSATEIRVYLTGLSYDSVSVQELEKQTNIKRTTIYHALDTLGAKGLVASSSAGGVRLRYTMTSPKHLERVLAKKIEKLQAKQTALAEIIPLLSARSQKNEEEVRVKRYDGIEGVKTALEEALYCKYKKWDIIAPQKNFLSEFNREYAQYFMQTRSNRGIVTRSLWEQSDKWRQLTSDEVRIRQPRFLPESMTGHFRSLIILFDDTVAYITSLDNASAILIESKELSATMKGLFEALWVVSTVYKPKGK